jgi:hypothetical protein
MSHSQPRVLLNLGFLSRFRIGLLSQIVWDKSWSLRIRDWDLIPNRVGQGLILENPGWRPRNNHPEDFGVDSSCKSLLYIKIKISIYSVLIASWYSWDQPGPFGSPRRYLSWDQVRPLGSPRIFFIRGWCVPSQRHIDKLGLHELQLIKKSSWACANLSGP